MVRLSRIVAPARGLCLLLLAFVASGAVFPSVDRAAASSVAAPSLACRSGQQPAGPRAEDQLVLTYLYYWYDALSLDDPGLTLHPPSGTPFDWADPSWHRQQLADMTEAGVDVALAVYWGDGPTWSIHGLDALVAARESLLISGQRPPTLGLFFDSNLYANLLADFPALGDLTSDAGLDIFAGQIASFFERVPPCHWARIDGRPLIFLWRPDTEDGGVLRFEPSTLEALYARLERRLGMRPYIVRERTWDSYARAEDLVLETEDVFAWGAALQGPLFAGRTAAVGPGYDDRLLVDRPGYVRDRDGGQGYARDLREVVLSGAPWLLLETWNELWEASAIGETAQYGRAYLSLTREYLEVFRRLGQHRVRDGWVDLGHARVNYLAWLTEAPEERGTPVFVGGRIGARPHVEPEDGAGYFQFALPPRLRPDGSVSISVRVEYFDDGDGSFLLEYDGEDEDAPGKGAFTPTAAVTLEGTASWRTHEFILPSAGLRRRQYGGYGDFRIQDLPTEGEPPHIFGRVVVSVAPSDRPILLGPEDLSALGPRSGHFFELHWRGVTAAAAYAVELLPPDTGDRTPHAFTTLERQRCQGGPAWTEHSPTRALTAETRCLLEHVPSIGAGLYRWRVQGLDARGEPVGEPSDWGLLLASP